MTTPATWPPDSTTSAPVPAHPPALTRLEDHPGPGEAIADVGGVGELVTRLAHELAAKLNANRHKRHWRHPTVETAYLIGRLLDEVDELVEAVIDPATTPAAAWSEAADVAAFASFLADRIGRT